MKSEITSNHSVSSVEHELDLRGLFRLLWAGKLWIIGLGLLFSIVAFVFSLLVKQEWSSIAVTDKPTVNMLGDYYLQREFLNGLEAKNSVPVGLTQSIITDVYGELIVQLGAYDTRREFWLQTEYYRKRQTGEGKGDNQLLDELINKIKYSPRDDKKSLNDTIKLTAETAAEANQLLRQYVAFAGYKTVKLLNAELHGNWQANINALQVKLKQQEVMATSVYQREKDALERGLKIAQQEQFTSPQPSLLQTELTDSELFLLGPTILRARLEALNETGPVMNENYSSDKALLTQLQGGFVPDEKFQTYRYLRTPEEPVKRDSPRRGFWAVLWGMIGLFAGTGIVLVRRITDKV